MRFAFGILAMLLVGCTTPRPMNVPTPSTGKAIVRLERANAALVRAGEAVQQAEAGIAQARHYSGRNEAKAVLILDTLRRRNGGKLP